MALVHANVTPVWVVMRIHAVGQNDLRSPHFSNSRRSEMKRSAFISALVAFGLVLGVLPATPSYAVTGAVSVSVSSISRNAETGYLIYSVSASASGLDSDSGPCGQAGRCEGQVEALGVGDVVHALTPSASFSGVPMVSEKSWTGEVYYERITAVRAHVWGYYGELVSAWIPVADPYPATNISVAVNTLERDTNTGYLTYDFDFDATRIALPHGVCGDPWRACEGGVQARFASDQSVHSLTRREGAPWPNPLRANFASTAYFGEIDAVRGYLSSRIGTEYGPWIVVSDPYPDPSLQLSVNALGRNSDTGFLDYDIDISVAGVGLPTGVCGDPWRSCAASIQARFLKDGSVHQLSAEAGVPWPNSLETNFTSSAYYDRIDAVRTILSSRNGQEFGPWVAVTDDYPDPKLSVKVNTIERNAKNGYLDYNIDLSVSGVALPDGACGEPWRSCEAYVQARFESDQSVHRLTGYAGVPWPKSVTKNFESSAYYNKIDAVRAVISSRSGETYGRWVAVKDPYKGPKLKVVVDELHRVENSDRLDFKLKFTGSDYSTPEGPCPNFNNGCSVVIEARQVSDGLAYTVSHSTDIGEYPGKAAWNGSATIGEIDAVRARVSSRYSTAYGDWVEVSENVKGGHDLDESYALALAAVGASSSFEACYVAFSIGTHTKYNSTATDQHLDCTAALSKGKTFAQFLKTYIGTLSGKQVSALLVSLGVAEAVTTAAVSPDLDYNKTLPAGCTWLSYATIGCSQGGQTTEYRPITAPPKQDSVWSQNQAARAEEKRQEAGQPSGDIPSRVIVPGDIPQPLDNLTPTDMDVALAEQCTENMLVFGELSGLNDDDCETLPIFGTGMESPEATQHDLDAITAFPAWMKLTFVRGDEKIGTRGPSRTADICLSKPAGYHCDEFPYWTTAEGWPTAYPSLRVIPGSDDNSVQGGYYRAFAYTKCPKIASSAPGSDDRKFLVVPLPFLPTWTKC